MKNDFGLIFIDDDQSSSVLVNPLKKAGPPDM